MGFHDVSSSIKRLAPVNVKPSPPAFEDIKNKLMSDLLLKISHCLNRSGVFVVPSKRKNECFVSRNFAMKSNDSLNGEKRITLSPLPMQKSIRSITTSILLLASILLVSPILILFLIDWQNPLIACCDSISSSE